MILRNYQQQIIDECRKHMLAGRRAILIQLSTGGGKTAIASYMLKSSASKGMPAWFACNRRELVKQTMNTLDKFEVYHGVIAAGFMEDPKPLVQVCSIQTLANRLDRTKKPKLIFWDEAHGLGAKSWEKIFKANPQAFHIGLTASPIRGDGRGLGDFFEVMVKGPTIKELTEAGFLAPYRAFAPARVDLSGIHTSMGDFAKGELSSAMDKPSITGSAVEEYRKRARGKRNLVFCTSIMHSQHVAAQFRAAGFAAAHVDGDTPSEERDTIIKKFAAGDVQVLTSCEIFTVGFDCPGIEVVTLLRPTQSVGLFVQMCGRGLRVAPGKSEVIFLDHSNLFETHGLPDDDREWSLAGAERKRGGKSESVISVKVCPNCFAAQKSGPPVCSTCGTAFEIKSRKVEEVDGTLTEITAAELARRREIKQRKSQQGMAQTFDQLVAIGKSRKMKDPEGWSRIIMRSRSLKGRI